MTGRARGRRDRGKAGLSAVPGMTETILAAAFAHDCPHWANGPELGAPGTVGAVCICHCPGCCGHQPGDRPAAGEPGRCPGCSCYLADP